MQVLLFLYKLYNKSNTSLYKMSIYKVQQMLYNKYIKWKRGTKK